MASVLGRSEASLENCLHRLEGKHLVRVVCMDLASVYRSLVRKHFPNARIVADRFHVIRLINQGRQSFSPLSAVESRNVALSAPAVLWQYGDMLDKERSREVRRHIRRILMAEWDPIGVSDIPEAANEYDSYLGGVYELLERDASEGDIGDYLQGIEVHRMELVLPEARRYAAASSLKKLGSYFTETT